MTKAGLPVVNMHLSGLISCKVHEPRPARRVECGISQITVSRLKINPGINPGRLRADQTA